MSTPFYPNGSATGESAASGATVVSLVEESVHVGTQRVDQGGYRISKRVSVRDEMVDEPLTSQTVDVERRLIGRLLGSMEAPTPRQEGDTWILPVVEEVVVTEKRLMLKEEIRITCTARVRRQVQHVSLRSETVSIEQLVPGDSPDVGSS